jgi:PGF-pre-PGF domain-containing protein
MSVKRRGEDRQSLTFAVEKELFIFLIVSVILLFVIIADAPLFVITVHSPQNITYGVNFTELNVSARNITGSFSPQAWWYSLDGGTNTTFTPNITISDLSEGSHNLIVYANDSAGNIVTSNLQFSSIYGEWNKTFGGTDEDEAYSVQQTTDGGYILAGRTRSFGTDWDMWIIKTNSLGDHEWNKTFGNSSHEERARSIKQTSGGGYIVVGQTIRFGAGQNTDILVFKINSSGSHEWNKTFSTANYDYGESVQETSDGGYIIAGGNLDFWLIKLNSSGSHEWNKTVGGTGSDRANSVQQTTDGGYILGGESNSFSAFGDLDFWLVKTNSSGDYEWNRTFGSLNSDYDMAYSVQQTSDGGYVIAGAGDTLTDAEVWLIKTNSSGGKEWNKTFGGSGSDFARSIEQTSDGGYILAGYTSSFGAGGSDFWLVKTNSSGDHEWNKTFGGSSVDSSYSVQQTSDGGYIVGGGTYSFGAGNRDVWLIKVKATGETYFNVDQTPPTITINSPQNGSTTSATPLLNATFGEIVNTAWYSIDNGANQGHATATNNLTLILPTLSEGNHNVTVYANDSVGNTESNITYFSVDIIPTITINSPQNITYNTSSVNLDITANDSSANLESVWYNINGTNVTYTGITTLHLANGTHTLTAYANDTVGNMNSTNVTFNINIIDPLSSIINQELNTTNNQTNFTIGDIGIIVNTIQELNGTVNITTYIDNPPGVDEANSTYGLGSNGQGLERYIEFEPSENVDETSGNLSWVYFRMNYSNMDYSGLDESTIKFFWWNGTSWREVVTGANYTSENNGPYVYEAGVDTTNNYVWANLSHFSIYAIGGSIPAITIPEEVTPTVERRRGRGIARIKGEDMIDNIKAGGSGLAVFDLDATKYILEIELTSNEDVYNVKVTAEALDEKPYTAMIEPENEIFSYFNFDKIRITDDQITQAIIRFVVPVSWMKEKNISQDKVILKRYVNNEWEELETDYLSEDGTYVYFNAKSSGLSYFVITGTQDHGYKEPEIKEPEVVEPEVEERPAIGIIAAIIGLEEGQWKRGMFGIIVIVIIIVAVIMYRLRRKRKGF